MSTSSLLLLLAACTPAPTPSKPGEVVPSLDSGTAPTGTTDPGTTWTTPCEPVAAGTSAVRDEDGDCATADRDCDDLDPAVSPDARELDCDGLDNDCDGVVDESALFSDEDILPWYIDADGDGYAEETTESACPLDAPWVQGTMEGGDCDGSDPGIHPDRQGTSPRTGIDIPGDGIDQDCDGADACGYICVGYLCGFSTTEEGESFCETWTQAPSLRLYSPGADLTKVDCLCTPPDELVVYPSDGYRLDGVDAWFPNEVFSIVGGEETFRFEGMEGFTEIPARLVIQCKGGDDTSFDLHFDGLANVEHMVSLEIGYLTHGCLNTATAEDLTGLGRLRTVEQDILISDTGLRSLGGLEALEEVGGDFAVGYSPDLTDIRALARLRIVGGGLYLPDSVEDWSPLEGLERVGRELALRGAEVPTFSKLDSVGSLELEGTERVDFGMSFPRITSLVALTLQDTEFQDLQALTGAPTFEWLSVRYNSQLTGLSGLEGITALDGGLVIDSNDVLPSADGLENLWWIGDDLIITDNPSLVSLSALHGVEFVGGDVRIQDNDSLDPDEVNALVNAIGRENIAGAVITY